MLQKPVHTSDEHIGTSTASRTAYLILPAGPFIAKLQTLATNGQRVQHTISIKTALAHSRFAEIDTYNNSVYVFCALADCRLQQCGRSAENVAEVLAVHIELVCVAGLAIAKRVLWRIPTAIEVAIVLFAEFLKYWTTSNTVVSTIRVRSTKMCTSVSKCAQRPVSQEAHEIITSNSPGAWYCNNNNNGELYYPTLSAVHS